MHAINHNECNEDDLWYHCYQVYFTRNGKIVGKKDVVLPRGGFYPTVGMMSSQEKVKVELRPLSG